MPRTTTPSQDLIRGIWKENPVLIQMLGLCPALAVTNTVKNALAMSGATFFVICCSSGCSTGIGHDMLDCGGGKGSSVIHCDSRSRPVSCDTQVVSVRRVGCHRGSAHIGHDEIGVSRVDNNGRISG